MKDKLFQRSVWTLLTCFFAFILLIVLITSSIASAYSMFVDQFFDVSRYILVQDEAAEQADTQYFKSDFAKKDADGNLILNKTSSGIEKQIIDEAATDAYATDVSERVNEEGMVLLWNKNNALPLAKNSKVSNFGLGSISWIYQSIGSSRVSMYENIPDLPTSLRSRDLQVNDKLLEMIKMGSTDLGYTIGSGKTNEMPWDEYSPASINSVSEYGDAAIFTVARFYGEGGDTNDYTNLSEDGSVLSFSKNELSVLAGLQKLKNENKIEKIILLIDNTSPMSLKNVEKYDVDACIWTGWGGAGACDAIADVLVGNSNPSGHLTDTWVYDIKSAPSNENFGNFTYRSITQPIPNGNGDVPTKYVVYQEGIYVGYRYYETRYEDLVIGGRNANSAAGIKYGKDKWSYGDEVAYAFGHGESYTDFEYSDYSVKKNGRNYEVTMTIKNVGSVAGKDVMQVYLQKPYTEYDKTNKIEKASAELVGFAKTKLLEPGESDTLTVNVSEYEFKSYDSYGKGTYILERGDYWLAAGFDAHDAVNNILAAKGYDESRGMDAKGNASLTYKAVYGSDDYDTYSVSPFTGAKIENRFDNADVNRYAGMEGQSVTYLSRNNWADTYSGGVTLSLTTEILANELQYDKEVPNDPNDKMPKYNTVTSEYGKLNLIQLMGIPYNNQLWEDLLNQTTFKEQVNLCRSIGAGATSISAPGAPARDGPCGLGGSGVQLPGNPIVASTFNKELAEELGKAFGMECMKRGTVGIYGVGNNIHRSAYGGRCYEYYSEDSFLSGVIGSAASKGLRSKGVILYTKHFALNDQETNRSGVATWSNEQAIREIYLKSFETGITDGYTNGLMTSYNRIGGTWSGQHKGLLTDVLRGEWGFKGVCITDACGTNAYMGGLDSIHATAILAGQDTWMGNFAETALDQYKDNATVCLAIREVAHRNLYNQLNSFAMNGMSTTTRVVEIMPGWEIAILVVEIVSGVFAALCLGMTVASWILWYRKKQTA